MRLFDRARSTPVANSLRLACPAEAQICPTHQRRHLRIARAQMTRDRAWCARASAPNRVGTCGWGPRLTPLAWLQLSQDAGREIRPASACLELRQLPCDSPVELARAGIRPPCASQRRSCSSVPPHPAAPVVGRTPRISCEAVPASILAGAGMSRHLRPRNGAGESFVSFIRLFGGTSTPTSSFRLALPRERLPDSCSVPRTTLH